MRVISGILKGRKLLSPKGREIRPTTDRVKEAIFSMIYNDIYNCSFLDLFSGSASIGIEALSRGAKSCIFVDDSKESLSIIKENILNFKKFLSEKHIEILALDVKSAINKLSHENKKVDIIFMDPPYNFDITTLENIIINIINKKILNENGYIILECINSNTLPNIKDINIVKNKSYALTKVLFLEYTGGALW